MNEFLIDAIRYTITLDMLEAYDNHITFNVIIQDHILNRRDSSGDEIVINYNDLCNGDKEKLVKKMWCDCTFRISIETLFATYSSNYSLVMDKFNSIIFINKELIRTWKDLLNFLNSGIIDKVDFTTN